MITGAEDIATLFCIFHDGEVTLRGQDRDTLTLDVAISYLARRVAPGFSGFRVELSGARGLVFKTWPKDPLSPPALLTGVARIFEAELDVLEASARGSVIEILFNQPSPTRDHCGGELQLEVDSATVRDEAGREHSLEDLRALATSYWTEWREKNRPG